VSNGRDEQREAREHAAHVEFLLQRGVTPSGADRETVRRIAELLAKTKPRPRTEDQDNLERLGFEPLDGNEDY
jgi:hypothetical protein